MDRSRRPGAPSPLRFRDDLRELVFHSSSALAMRVMRSLSSFLFNLVLARMLGASGTGMYFLALSITELPMQVARVGLDGTVVRLLAGGQGRCTGLYYRVVALVTAVGLVMTTVLLLAAPIICVGLFGEEALIAPLRLMSLAIVPWSLVFIHGSLLQGAGRIGLSIFVHFVALFLFGVAFLLLLGRHGSLEGAALAHVVATICVLGVGIVLWRRTTAGEFPLADHDLAPERWRTAVRASLSLCLIGLLSTAGALADTFLLGALATMEDLGTFRVAFRVAVLGAAALDAVGTAIAPRLAAHHNNGDWRALEQTARAGTALAVLLTVPYWLLVFGFPRDVLGLFGEEFTTGAGVVVILMIGRMVSTIAGPVDTLLAMSALERPLRNLTMVVTVLRVAFLWLAIPIWGLLGVAVVGCVSEIAKNAVATLLVRRRLGIVVLPLPRRVVPYRTDRTSRVSHL